MAHVLICTPAFPASENDVDCAPAMMQLVDALRRDGLFDISVIATQYPFRSGTYQWNGITVHACDGRNSALRKPSAILRGLRFAEAIIRRTGTRHVHAFWMGDAAFVAHRAAGRAGLPCSVTLMGRDARDGRRWWNVIRRRTPPHMIALCERQAMHFERMSGRPVDTLIPFGLAEEAMVHTRRPIEHDVLFCGSMYAIKRPLLFIEVIRRVAAIRPLKAVMVGQGPVAPVRRALADMPECAQVQLLGAVPRSHVLDLMQRTRVLLHTAAYEGQCFAFDEAAAMGMRLVTTAVGSARPDPWWRVADDADGLAAALIQQLDAREEAPPRILHSQDRCATAYVRVFMGD